ncbi:hypothetical protein Tco_0206436 [Tanacetum coccineum]
MFCCGGGVVRWWCGKRGGIPGRGWRSVGVVIGVGVNVMVVIVPGCGGGKSGGGGELCRRWRQCDDGVVTGVMIVWRGGDDDVVWIGVGKVKMIGEMVFDGRRYGVRDEWPENCRNSDGSGNN